MTTTLHRRDYGPLLTRADLAGGHSRPRTESMHLAVDALWDAFHTKGVSWVGFYLAGDDRQSMTLGARRDKPACSPIGLHGACGQCFRSGKPLVVRDVAELGEGYIACDPRDRSEVVIPLFDEALGERSVGGAPGCWGVLDVDSHDVGAFSEHDAQQLLALMRRMGLSSR